eukprot:Pompholyxophrys_punicea_v1_NODE_168_length_3036_cov_10.830594.p2 type:complete len:220 gc:universal NODE_168_length_3036_cov_10.830594:1441-2100(+)
MEVRKGLIYCEASHCLVGKVTGPVYEIDVNQHNWFPNTARATLASHVAQIFLVSSDGATSLPLGFVPTTAITGEQLYKLTCRIRKLFSESRNVRLRSGSSDGFVTNVSFLKLMQKEIEPYWHFFDYIHIIKNLRNRLINITLKTKECTSGFNMNDLVKLRQMEPIFQKALPLDPNPKDRMEVKNVQQLTDSKFLLTLKNYATANNSQPLLALHKYFYIM